MVFIQHSKGRALHYLFYAQTLRQSFDKGCFTSAQRPFQRDQTGIIYRLTEQLTKKNRLLPAVQLEIHCLYLLFARALRKRSPGIIDGPSPEQE